MDFEQIVKRLQWLDEEHRKDKAAIIALEEELPPSRGTLTQSQNRSNPSTNKYRAFHLPLPVSINSTRLWQINARR